MCNGTLGHSPAGKAEKAIIPKNGRVNYTRDGSQVGVDRKGRPERGGWVLCVIRQYREFWAFFGKLGRYWVESRECGESCSPPGKNSCPEKGQAELTSGDPITYNEG